jgi:HAE1 family hydrophobic/amphiphilic exporter-1
MRSIIEFAVSHRVTMLMVTSAAVLFGVVSLGRLPVQLLPDISYPTLTVQTELPDAAPSEVENLLSRPLEEGMGVVPGLRRMSSISQPGLSEITLEFGWDTDMDFAALDVREKMDLIRLPDDAKSPVVLRYDPSLDPVVRLGLSGSDNAIQLRHLADQLVKKELEALDGVAAAKLSGGLNEEIHVDVDDARLAQLGIPIAEVARRVGSENVNAAGGRLRDRDSQFLIRTLNEYKGPEDVAAIIVHRDGDRVVKLGDVAKVTRAYKEREIVSRIDGQSAVEIAIYKEGDANIVDVAKRVKLHRGRLAAMLPEGIELKLLSDQSVFIESAVKQVQQNAMLGGVLAVLVLLVFLRDVRSTAIIAIAIPTSIVTTFVLMYRQGVTLNVMSLGGLALGVGMLVDNSIVVLESIVRHRQSGSSRRDAAVDGASEVAQAVTASTLTTIAVFLPILFVEGIARQIFKDQALTVAYALMVSLVVALTLTPMLAALGSKKEAKESARAAEQPPEGGLHRFYRRILIGALRHRALSFGVASLMFVLALGAAGKLGHDLIPQMSQGEFRLDLQLAEGTPIEMTDAVSRQLELAVAKLPEVETVFANVGLDARESGSSRSRRENHSELNVRLRDGIRGAAEAAAVEHVRAVLANDDRVRAELLQPNSFSFKTPVAVQIYGYDLGQLESVCDEVVGALVGIQGLEDVHASIEPGSPEVQVRFHREKLQAAGLTLNEASNALRTKILGDIATDYKERDRQIDILVRSEQAQSFRLDDLRTAVVGHRANLPIRLTAVADISIERGPARIQRLSQSRAAVVSANLHGRDLGGVSQEIETRLAGIALPPSVSFDLGGQNDEMTNSLGSLRFAVLLAIFLVYLVMASQFESLLDPLLILITMPLAFVGVAGALLITNTPVSVVVMIGGIMLAGIVVNNGIVLVDLIGQLRRRGERLRDAIVTAGTIRLRPILMTTTTTVLGLLPLALGRGEGAEIGAPLAITVIGGLLVSTMLTLVIIPLLYSVAHREG